MSRQILANPKVEICAFNGNEWIRIAGSLVEDDRVEARASMLDAYPSLKNMYAADDGNTQVFYFKDRGGDDQFPLPTSRKRSLFEVSLWFT